MALDRFAGLPSATGVNSLTLNGTFDIADCFNTKNQAKILMSAFNASDGTPPAASEPNAQQISTAELPALLKSIGM